MRFHQFFKKIRKSLVNSKTTHFCLVKQIFTIYSENPLESSIKYWREIFRKRVRHCCLEHKTKDALNHRWLQTDPILRKKYQVKTHKEPVISPTDDILYDSMFLD